MRYLLALVVSNRVMSTMTMDRESSWMLGNSLRLFGMIRMIGYDLIMTVVLGGGRRRH